MFTKYSLLYLFSTRRKCDIIFGVNYVYKTIESFICSKKNNPLLCEDGLFANEYFVAVVDGVTSKGNYLHHGQTGGRLAMEIVLDAMEKLDADVSPELAVKQLNDAVGNGYGAEKDKAAVSPEMRMQACVIIYSCFRREVWCYGDCQCIINGRLFSQEKEFDRIASEARAMFLDAELACGKTVEELSAHDTGREFIMPLLRVEGMLANSPGRYGYENISGFGLLSDSLRVFDVPAGSEVVLASDGYPLLCDTLEKSEKELARIIREDPLCFLEYKSTKGLVPGNASFDDRTYIRFKT